MGRPLFCRMNPAFYKISVKKEMLCRKIKDAFCGDNFAAEKTAERLPNIVKGHRSLMLRRLEGVDMELQYNKVNNLRLACKKLDGLVVKPGETFSFWKTVGRTEKKDGYLEGLVICGGKVEKGFGGGLCQLANMVHWLVLNSPLTVTELHHHSDALFPDERRKVPFGSGTSIMYNYVDYRFRNDTEQPVQICVWLDEEDLCGELRSETAFSFRYRLEEENHHFSEENGVFYRVSQVYRYVIDRETGAEIRKELILSNHSRVLYDYSLIPKEEIRNDPL